MKKLFISKITDLAENMSEGRIFDNKFPNSQDNSNNSNTKSNVSSTSNRIKNNSNTSVPFSN